MILPIIILFTLGLAFGSFLNVVADRLINGESIVFGRSHCDKCRRILKPSDLIPVASFLWSRGRCVECQVKLSWWYPISELVSGVNFVLAYLLADGINFQFLFYTVILSVYLVIFLTDAKYFLIPDLLIIIGSVFVLIYRISYLIVENMTRYRALGDNYVGKYLIDSGYFKDLLWVDIKELLVVVGSAIGIALFFYVLVLITRGKGMGTGDITLGFLIGLVNGFPNNVLAIFLGFVFGTVYSIPLLALRSKKLKDPIPFGPFLILGSVTALIFGEEILNWYSNLVLF